MITTAIIFTLKLLVGTRLGFIFGSTAFVLKGKSVRLIQREKCKFISAEGEPIDPDLLRLRKLAFNSFSELCCHRFSG